MRERLTSACLSAGRDEHSVTLMAVSKQQPAAAMQEAARCGVTLFGENRVQEFATKREQLGPHFGAEVQMIGHLQSNKAKLAAEIFSGVHSLDSCKLAEKLNAEADALGKKLDCWIEIKLSDESTKTGLLPDSTDLYELLERVPLFGALRVLGLMTVPPWSENAEDSRRYFAELRDLRDRTAARYPRVALVGLSMGMSHDFEVAIQEGATLVRVGTDIFGPRSK